MTNTRLRRAPANIFLLAALLAAVLSQTNGQEQPKLSMPSDSVPRISEVRVPYGRSVFVNPTTELSIKVKRGDHCFINTLPDVLNHQPGALSPPRFPCDFRLGEVSYSHFGSRSPSEHTIRLQVRYDTATATYIMPITLPIKVLFTQRTVLTSSQLVIVDLLGLSDPIDDTILNFAYKDDETCQITTQTQPQSLPRYGSLVDDPSEGEPVPCDDFLLSGVKYQHSASTDSPNRDDIPMVVEIFNENNQLVKQEYFQVTVKIENGKENTPPKVDFSSMLMLEVDQFVMTAITPELLKGADVESYPEDLIFNMTTPLASGEGQIVSTDDRNQKLTSFRQADINDFKIAYVPPSEDSNDQQVFKVEFQIIDTEGALSNIFDFVIVVKPMNTLAPVVTKNTGQLLYQGESRALTTDQVLVVSDGNDLENVHLSVINPGPRHGLLLPEDKDYFTPSDLDAGLVVYQHDGSKTYSDNIVFQMTDGQDVVEFLFPITIAIVDNQPPILESNTGLTINKGATEIITSWILSASDIDSSLDDIDYVLEEPYSTYGKFIIITEEPIGDLDGWVERVDGKWEKEVKEFSQNNISDMELHYRHTGMHSTEVVLDKVKFHIQDSSEPPNRSQTSIFVVKIMPVDDIAPKVDPIASLQMDVKEFELTTLGKRVVRYTDEDTPGKDLVYTVTGSPVEIGESTLLPDAGKLVLTEEPDTEVTSFTQAQINHNKIAYQPPDTELGIVARTVQFSYAVSDDAGNTLPDQSFTIFLRPVDNKPPQIVNTGFVVRERNMKMITPDILDATDEDTDNDVLTFTVTVPPEHGFLQYEDTDISTGGIFTTQDLARMRILYLHDGDESPTDQFKLDVSDGMHNIPITVKVKVEPIDDETPEIVAPLNGKLEFTITVNERGEVVITNDVLSATDTDTDDLLLTFLVNTPPQKGQIVVDGEEAASFTQQNVQDGLVAYRHAAGEIGPEEDRDSFALTLTDLSNDFKTGGNLVDVIDMNVKILPVDTEAPIIPIGETFEVVEADKATIEPRHIIATDVDTADDEILCTITTQAKEGFLENSSPAPGSEHSREGTPISSFTIADIKAGYINYVQSIHNQTEPIEDRLSFMCQDGTPNLSENKFFSIAIYPTNDEEPILYNEEFVVNEGGALMIDRVRLNADDLDIPEDQLTFTITQKPTNGHFVRQGEDGPIVVETFSLVEIGSGADIAYQHDDSETTSDKFEIMLSDGKHEVKRVIPIVILAVDDETPRLTINNGIDVNILDSTVITNKALKATDLDSDDGKLRYVITFSPQHGNLSKVSDNGYITQLFQGDNFTQADIDNSRISYIHTGQEGVRDLIKFDVTDGFNPLIDRYFYVNVESIDMQFPDVINKGVTLKEGGRVKLTTDILSTADLNSADQNLEFTIAHAPTRGHLENTDMPGVPITTFSQLDLAGNKVEYVHTEDDEIKMDSFEFEVTDGFNPVYRTFRISISDVDNKKPVVTISRFQLKEGTSKLITPFELKVEDHDTSDIKLEIRLTQVPVHGKILLNGRKTRRFTMDDLNEHLVQYAHDGSETKGDSFSFVVSDGTHSDFFVFPDTVFPTEKPQRMDIEVIAIDNGIPQMLVNRGAPTISELPTGDHGFRITKKALQADDRDSDISTIKYIVTEPTENGFLINLANEEVDSVEEFTQGDIDDMNMYYILNKGSDATSDKFSFKLQDEGENELESQVFMLNWAVISLANATFAVTEEEKYITITLLRRGYLGETSFVTIQTENGTAKEGEDFKQNSANQVQFNPGQTEGIWKIRILPDEDYEEIEDFVVKLSEPVMGILEEPSNATVTITDPEDESTVYIPLAEYKIEEDIGEFMVPVLRSGDISNQLKVICYTEQGTAAGTTANTVLSFMDYISRPDDHNSILTFQEGESVKACKVVIIDDSLFEKNETFKVKLGSPLDGRLGEEFNSTTIVITSDTDDEPSFYFENEKYEVDESDGIVEVRLWRTGTDLSQTASVTVLSKQTEPESAKANEDYVGISETINFLPGITMQTVKVNILDDLGNPILEGVETFELVLRMPVGAVMGEPNVAYVVINDTVSDLPLMQFDKEEYEVNEIDRAISVKVKRSGDLSHPATVRCFTRQATAEVVKDYGERPNTNASVVKFEPGQSENRCSVVIEDDHIHEEVETFRLVLGSPWSDDLGEGKIGKLGETLIKITDDADIPRIGFAKTTYEVVEPETEDEEVFVNIPVIRTGDLSQVSVVRFYTKDGNAESGIDYNPVSKELTFEKDVTEHVIKIPILYDEDKEIRESFTVRLEPDSNMVATIKEKRAIVYINQQRVLADVTFPSPPNVVSLTDYDDMQIADANPVSGYPVICVTPCNPKHVEYEKVASLCTSEGIDDKATKFRWLIAAPSGRDNVTNPLREMSQNTFFTDTRSITLDSIYFKPGSRVSCVARAVNTDGDVGLESKSEPITISSSKGLCPPRVAGAVGAEPFSAKIRYTGPADVDYPNLIKLTVSMPHIDGMLPVISTRQPSNFEITLSKDGSRAGNHRCSNIINFDEIVTQHGFLSEMTRDPNVIGGAYPYQYNVGLRGNETLRFYKNLNLEACLWEFTSYYDMSELLTECGGSVGTDGQVKDLVQSFVSLRVPLFVSYIFHSPVASGWQHFDQNTELLLTFTYDTAILWENGIGSPPESDLQGYLYPTSMRIRDDGRLVVNFRTEARFRGQFVLEHSGTENQAMVMSANHPELQMSLNLIRSEATFNEPKQQWSFVSDYAIRDYSGTYTIKLIPCTTPSGQAYSNPITCNPREPLTFDMEIRFQQVSDPVSSEFSLNTNFFLLSKRDLWLGDGSMGFSEDSDVAFVEGSEIYGRVMVDPVQNLGDSFDASIEKVFLCTGTDGYVPKYDPTNNEYGCVADSESLQYQFKVLDKQQPDTQDEELNNVRFQAKLALDDPEALTLVRQSGTDGFRLNSSPLFTVTVGREWYLHAIYTVKSKDRQKRSTLQVYNTLIKASELAHHSRKKRSAPVDLDGIGKEEGTNMMYVKLNRKADAQVARKTELDVDVTDGAKQGGFPYIALIIAGGVVAVVIAIVVVVVIKKKKNGDGRGAYAGAKTVASGGGNAAIAMTPTGGGRYSSGYSSTDGSEV